MDITNEQGKKFIEALRTENRETVQNLMPFCSNYTLHIICGNLFVFDISTFI